MTTTSSTSGGALRRTRRRQQRSHPKPSDQHPPPMKPVRLIEEEEDEYFDYSDHYVLDHDDSSSAASSETGTETTRTTTTKKHHSSKTTVSSSAVSAATAYIPRSQRHTGRNWNRPYDCTPVMDQTTVAGVGVLLFLLASLWPPLLLLCTYIASKLIPYTFRENDDAATRRELYAQFLKEHHHELPERMRNSHLYVNIETSYRTNARYVIHLLLCGNSVCFLCFVVIVSLTFIVASSFLIVAWCCVPRS